MKKYYKKIWFKLIYLLLVMIFWLGLGIIFHALVEYPILYFLTKNFAKFSLNFNYDIWLTIHNIFSFIILIFFVLAGIFFGFQWYDYIYVKYDHVKYDNKH